MADVDKDGGVASVKNRRISGRCGRSNYLVGSLHRNIEGTIEDPESEMKTLVKIIPLHPVISTRLLAECYSASHSGKIMRRRIEYYYPLQRQIIHFGLAV